MQPLVCREDIIRDVSFHFMSKCAAVEQKTNSFACFMKLLNSSIDLHYFNFVKSKSRALHAPGPARGC